MDNRDKVLAGMADAMIPVVSTIPGITGGNGESSNSANGENSVWDTIKNMPPVGHTADVIIKGSVYASNDPDAVEKNDLQNSSREELIQKYLDTVQNALNNIETWEAWVDDSYYNKLMPSTEDLETRSDCVKKLIEIDSKSETNHVVYKFQMDILGKLAVPTMKIFDMVNSRKYITKEHHVIRFGENMKDAFKPMAEYPVAWEDNDHEFMNAILRDDMTVFKHRPLKMIGQNMIEDSSIKSGYYKIENKNSLRFFFDNLCCESKFGREPLQKKVKVVERIGGGYIMLTGSGNYDKFALFMDDSKINNNGKFDKITLNQALFNYDDIPLNNFIADNYFGPGYVALKYPWQASAFYWKVLKFPKFNSNYEKDINESGMQNMESIDNMVSQGHDLRYITCYMYSSGSAPKNESPGDNFFLKKVLNLFIDTLFS